MAYGPDVVLLGYVLNDSEDANAAEARRVADWAEAKQPPGGLFRHSALFRLVRHAPVGDRGEPAPHHRLQVDVRRRRVGMDRRPPCAARHGRQCRERGVPFVVAIFPLFGNPLDERYPFPEVHARVAQAAADAGAKVVDLLPAYRGLRWDILVVDGADDEHPNEIAHRIAANVLLHALDEVVPWTTPRGPDETAPLPSPSAP